LTMWEVKNARGYECANKSLTINNK